MKKYSILFFLISFIVGTETFLITPILPTLSRVFAVSTATSGLMVSAYTIGYALLVLFVGPFTEGRDRKRVMLLGLACFTLFTFLCALAGNFTLMLIFRFLAGASASLVTPQVWASVPLVATGHDRVRMMGIIMSGYAVATVLGVPIGSFLSALGWQVPFFVIAGTLIVLMAILMGFLPRLDSPKPADGKRFVAIYSEILRHQHMSLYLSAFGLVFVGTISVFSFIGTWFAADFHLSVIMIGWALMGIGLGQFIGSFFGPRLVKKLGNSRSMTLAFAAWLLVNLVLPFAGNALIASIILALTFMVNGFIVPVMMTTIQSKAAGNMGTVSSLANFAMYVCQSVGAGIGGPLIIAFPGYFGLAWGAVLLYALSALLFRVAGFWRR